MKKFIARVRKLLVEELQWLDWRRRQNTMNVVFRDCVPEDWR